ncbi:hypothetical protein Ddc_16660 [Ditylenchus destructor]|nr:hypothetical protein Ddc_16660 [Ditylenchus destructor]
MTTIWMNENRRTVLILCLVPVTVYLAYKAGCYWTGASVYKNIQPWMRHGPNATMSRITGLKWANAGKNAGFTVLS